MKKDHKNSIRKELSEMGSKLGKPEKEAARNEFVVPEDYFEQLPGQVQERILAARESRKPLVVGYMYRKVVPVVSVVVVLAVVATGLFFFGRNDAAHDLAMEDYYELPYFDIQSDMELAYLYDVVLASDLTADEILYELDYGFWDDELFGDDFEAYEDLMDEIFERSHYYGMDSMSMLSYLD